MFEHFPRSLGDPIFSLQESWARDDRRDKVNLSIGLYYTEDGHIPELAAVREARARVIRDYPASGYLPMAGSPAFRAGLKDLLFGPGLDSQQAARIATIQSIGGSGALKVGADLLKEHFPDSQVWVSDPTWDNHVAIFEGAGFRVARYPYFDPRSNGVDFEGMRRCLAALPPHSIVLLHPCCHNPTGADLTREQWDEIVHILADRHLIPFLDLAYQGYGQGIEDDAYLLRALAAKGVSFLVSSSFSKTFSLYKERCGGLSIVCRDAEECARVLGQMEKVVRRTYSSPPFFGSELVATVLADATLRKLWMAEVEEMRVRIVAMRSALRQALESLCAGRRFDYLERQRGMFSFTGLSSDKVARLREESGIYLVETGRLCLTGLNTGNIERVARAIAKVI